MLHGHHIVITRPIEQAQKLAEVLKARGAIPLFYPGLTYGPPKDPEALDNALTAAAPGHYNAIILTSGEAARVIKERLIALNLSLAEQTIWAVGPQTAAACQFEATIHVPEQAQDAKTLLDALPDVNGKRILLPQSPLSAPTLHDGLIARGAQVTVVHPYSVIAGQGGDDVPDLIRRGLISAFTFFSGSAVEGVMARLDAAGLSLDAVRAIPAVCFGASTAAVARALGLHTLEGDTTYETFYRLIEQACAGNKRIP